MSAPALTNYQSGMGVVTGDNLNTFAQTCDNVAQLRAFPGAQGVSVITRGQIIPSDSNGGYYWWNAASTAIDDGLNVITPTGYAAIAGRWLRAGFIPTISPAMAPVVGAATVAIGATLLEESLEPAIVPSSQTMPQAVVATSQIIRAAGTAAAPLTVPTDVITAALYSNYAPGTGNVQQGAVIGLAHSYAPATGANANTRGFFGEAVDHGGNTGLGVHNVNFVEGGRFQGVADPGVAYTATYGLISYANCPSGQPYTFIIGHESQIDNQYANANVSKFFNNEQFAVSYLATCGESSGTFTCDAGFATNPYNQSLFQTGFLVPAASIVTSGMSVNASCVVGIDLADGAYSSAAIHIPNSSAISAQNGSGSALLNLMYLNPGNNMVIGQGVPSGGNIEAGAHLTPFTDNTYSLGSSLLRWTAVWAANGTIQTSDATQKTDIAEVPSTLGIVRSLTPRTYKWAVGGYDQHETTEDQSVHATTTRTVDTYGVEVQDGKAVLVPRTEVIEEYEWDSMPVFDAAGNPSLDHKGKPRIHRVPRMVTKAVPVTTQVPRAGQRTHWGFLANEVKAAMDASGLDFAGYVKAEDGMEGIRPDQLIPVLWKAVQELAEKVDELGSRVS